MKRPHYTERSEGIVIISERDHFVVRFPVGQTEEFFDHQYGVDEFSEPVRVGDKIDCFIQMAINFKARRGRGGAG